jgi:hypothetical protein
MGLLLESEPLQEELGITEVERRELETIRDNARDKMRDFFRQGRGGDNNQRGQRFGFDPQQVQQMQMAMAAMQEENEAAIRQVLTKEQLKRLNQIRLRILGPLGVAEEDIATAIGLLPHFPDRYEQVLAIASEMDRQIGELMRQNFETMRGQFGRGGPPGGGFPGGPPGAQGAGPGGRDRGQAANAPGGRGAAPGGRPQARPNQEDDDEEEDRADRGRGARERMAAFMNSEEGRALQAQMAELSKKQDEITKQAEAAIGKLLTPAEKKKFNSFLGPEFDIMKLAQPPQRGDRGRRGERDQRQDERRPAPPQEAEEPAEEEAPTPPARPQPRVRGAGSRQRGTS